MKSYTLQNPNPVNSIQNRQPRRNPPSFPQESEQERLLSLRAVLPNGRYGNVFERSYTGGVEHWYCNMCECPIMGRVYHHEIGKRHTSNLSSRDEDGGGGKHQAGGAQQQPQEPIVTVQVAPGEPVPPGFEGEVEKVCEIQVRWLKEGGVVLKEIRYCFRSVSTITRSVH